MIVRLSPSPDQIRWYAKSALNGFETLGLADAAENAKHDLRAILRYLDGLDRADDALLVSRVEAIKPGVRVEVTISDPDALDLADLEDSGLVAV